MPQPTAKQPIDRVISRQDAIAYINKHMPEIDGRLIACVFDLVAVGVKDDNKSLYTTFQYNPGSDTITYKEIKPVESIQSHTITGVQDAERKSTT